MNTHPAASRQWKRVFAASAVCLAVSNCFSTTTPAALPLLRRALTGKSNAAPNDRSDLKWHTDYATAHAEAKRKGRMLLVDFVPDADDDAQRQFNDAIKTDCSLQSRLRCMVLVRLPSDYPSGAPDFDGRLVDHSAFKFLTGKTGVAIIDLEHEGKPYYGKVVSALPFADGKYYRWRNSQLVAALDLPPGTITQRTMIWAVRIHPESPASTQGRCHSALAEAAKEHSEYQARTEVQGHQHWETRFHQVRAAANAHKASEVVAESWPNQNLIDSCIDCVSSWRYSPGHWSAVRGRHRLFGYDIRRGRNGIWFGTGIFAD